MQENQISNLEVFLWFKSQNVHVLLFCLNGYDRYMIQV